MFKKIISLVLALVVLASMAAIAVPASAAEDTKIMFEVPSDWKNYKTVYCHLWAYGSDTPLANWQSKKEACTLVEGTTYSYDTTKVGGLQAGVLYCVIFSLNTGLETYTTLMTTDCYGDTLYCNTTYYENPVDSNKTSRAAFWKNHSATQYGPLMQVTSIGNIVGTCIASSAQTMFTDFLKNNLDNARTYSKKSDQDIIDNIAKTLGLSKNNIETYIKDSGVAGIKWDKAKSTAAEDAKPVAPTTPIAPTAPGAVGTGQEMTIVYVAIAMMIASAGVVFFARKNRVTE